MAGYRGFSMSNNAVDAYEDGERPLSKWTKADILYKLGEKEQLCERLTLSELRSEFLRKSSWHHTSKHFNRTDFYSVNEENVENITEKDVQYIISSRVRKERCVVEKTVPTYITALVEYSEWEGTRSHPKKVAYSAVVQFMSTDKMINVNYTNKRKSSLVIVFQVEQKTKYASKEILLKKYEQKKKLAQRR